MILLNNLLRTICVPLLAVGYIHVLICYIGFSQCLWEFLLAMLQIPGLLILLINFLTTEEFKKEYTEEFKKEYPFIFTNVKLKVRNPGYNSFIVTLQYNK